MIPKDDFLISI